VGRQLAAAVSRRHDEETAVDGQRVHLAFERPEPDHFLVERDPSGPDVLVDVAVQAHPLAIEVLAQVTTGHADGNAWVPCPEDRDERRNVRAPDLLETIACRQGN